ncbi:hypothetical protein GQ457_01G025910 [Hibiscus cannabinus]
MPKVNQLISHFREEKWSTDCTRASDQCPQKQGVCPCVTTRTPKKPNSALRKITKRKRKSKLKIFSQVFICTN